MFGKKVIDRLDKMFDSAMNGTFVVTDYDESEISRLESKWKNFLDTSVLSNKRLETERKRLEQFISDISHQTKTPMTNIKMYTELLEEELCSNNQDSLYKVKQYVEEIKKQNNRLEFLINTLTKLSRIESGTLTIVPIDEDVGELIKNTATSCTPKAQNKNISIVIDNYDNKLMAKFDMKWTLEAMINVVDNAVKYSPEGGKVSIYCKEYEMYVAIYIVDEGKGITEAEATKIFGRFYRSEDVQQEEGVGIGLYLTREILSKEDGYIKVIPSEVNNGGKIIVFLRK